MNNHSYNFHVMSTIVGARHFQCHEPIDSQHEPIGNISMALMHFLVKNIYFPAATQTAARVFSSCHSSVIVFFFSFFFLLLLCPSICLSVNDIRGEGWKDFCKKARTLVCVFPSHIITVVSHSLRMVG